MNRDDHLYLAGFRAALDLAEQAGAAILQGQWGHPVRREHAAAGLLHFVDAAREELATNERALIAAKMAGLANGSNQHEKRTASEGVVETTPMVRRPVEVEGAETPSIDRHEKHSTSEGEGTPSPIGPSPHGGALVDRMAARSQGYSGDACDTCGSLSMKRSGSCLVCEACGTTSGCS